MISAEELGKTTFSGRRFSFKQLEQIRETVDLCKNLSRREIALTLCEHLNWFVPSGPHKINACITLLEQLEEKRFIELPKKQKTSKAKPRVIALTDRTSYQDIIDCSLLELGTVEVCEAVTASDKSLWNEFVERYHYLGYKHPFGSYLKYFIVSRQANSDQNQALHENRIILGCILFTGASAYSLECRDEWIAWSTRDKNKRLNLILNNSRFLILPWVQIKNLASHVISVVLNQLQRDWQLRYKTKPVLVETFVDTSKYEGLCYNASNWQFLGMSAGRGRFDRTNTNRGAAKKVFVYPLQSDFKEVLTNKKQGTKNESIFYRSNHIQATASDASNQFLILWDQFAKVVSDVACEFDGSWQIRSRVINSMLLILLIFRLVFSKNNQGYGTTITELWENARKMGVKLPQSKPIAASSFSEARVKLSENIFKCINDRLILIHEKKYHDSYLWHGHRIFAVDGSKINLPVELTQCEYTLPTEKAHYPQGLLSTLYQLHSQIPFDFSLESHQNERTSAMAHLKHLKAEDVVVYDRGYYSYELLALHHSLGIHAIFRMQTNAAGAITEFKIGDEIDQTTLIKPGATVSKGLRKSNPNLTIKPIAMRLIKYEVRGTCYLIGTTLLDRSITIQDLADAYYSRWGIEELYKVSKNHLTIEEFHSKSERGVKQELYAHLVLITLTRVFANKANLDLKTEMKTNQSIQLHNMKTNYKNCINVVMGNIEALFLATSNLIKNILDGLFENVIRYRQRIRPNRSYERKSMKPNNKWRSSSRVRVSTLRTT